MKKVTLTKAQVSTAIFEYLQRRGKTPNRKRGTRVEYGSSYNQMGVAQELAISALVR
jgi:hypothetical protein